MSGRCIIGQIVASYKIRLRSRVFDDRDGLSFGNNVVDA